MRAQIVHDSVVEHVGVRRYEDIKTIRRLSSWRPEILADAIGYLIEDGRLGVCDGLITVATHPQDAA